MDGVDIGMQQADRERLHALVDEGRDHAPGLALVERSQHAALGQQPLGDFAAEMSRHERGRRVDEQVVHVVAALGADLERVAEACGRQQRRAGALSLDQRIGRERGAVDDGANGALGHPGVAQQRLHTLLDALRRILRRRQDLPDTHGARRLVDDDEIRERPSDVHTEARVHAGSLQY